jgi:hypothetical protein
VVLICISFVTRDGEHFFMCFWAIRISSFEKVLFSSVAHFFIGSLILGEFSFLSSLYILVISPLSDVQLANIFSHSGGGLFSLETNSFVVQKLFSFMKSHLYILSLSCLAVGVLLRKSLPISISSRVFLAPSCTNFRLSGLIFRSLIHFELILVQGDKHGSSFSCLQMDNYFSQQHLLKRLSFLHCIFLAPLSKRWV